jgi:glycosyltransferase involved in cell wall biosynthesis
MSDTQPLVSAIVPVYNGEKYLSDTLESILGQTYSNLECLVVDDGSTDGTSDICKGFGAQIRLIKKPNGGVSSARNLGIREAGGKYVAFLDADDKWEPFKIATQVAAIDGTDAALCLAGVTFIDGDDNVIGKDSAPDQDSLIFNILTMGRETGFIATTGLAVKTAIEQVGYFDEGLSTSADADMVLRIVQKYRIITLPQQLGLYRHHTGQMHHNLAALEHDAHMVLDKFFSSKDVPEKYAAFRSAAYASLESTLGIGCLSSRNIGRGVSHLLKGFSHSPRTTLSKLGALLRSKIS